MIKVNKFNLFLLIRRFIGILILAKVLYFISLFAIKFILWFLYAGVEVIDSFFKFLVGWGGRMKIIKTVWYSLFTENPHAVGIVTVDTGEEIQHYTGQGEGKTSKEDAKKIVENGFRFYTEIFEVKEW